MDLNHRPHPYQGCALTKTELQTRTVFRVTTKNFFITSTKLSKQFVPALPNMKAFKAIYKEVIQPQVPLRLPCYDFTPVINHTVVIDPLSVSLTTSGATYSHGVTGGVYKARERIHRGVLIHDY